jgi:hypothetical protein
MSNLDHEAYLAAHYALGKVEVEQGFILTSQERSRFLKNFVMDYLRSKSLKDDSGKIEP